MMPRVRRSRGSRSRLAGAILWTVDWLEATLYGRARPAGALDLVISLVATLPSSTHHRERRRADRCARRGAEQQAPAPPPLFSRLPLDLELQLRLPVLRLALDLQDHGLIELDLVPVDARSPLAFQLLHPVSDLIERLRQAHLTLDLHTGLLLYSPPIIGLQTTRHSLVVLHRRGNHSDRDSCFVLTRPSHRFQLRPRPGVARSCLVA